MSAREQDPEPVCRICRCEATEDNPLFHPCKCRGSIKYIHQECLDEWLKLSKKKTCDICSQPFAFSFKFQEDTPSVVPLNVVFRDIVNTVKTILHQMIVVISLMSAFFIIPLEFPSFLRFFNYLLGCEMPANEHSIYSINIGDISIFKFYGFSGEPSESVATTVQSGWSYIIIIAISTVFVISAHSWVTTDAGFNLIIDKRIGVQFDAAFFEAMFRNALNLPPMPNENNHEDDMRDHAEEEEEEEEDDDIEDIEDMEEDQDHERVEDLFHQQALQFEDNENPEAVDPNDREPLERLLAAVADARAEANGRLEQQNVDLGPQPNMNVEDLMRIGRDLDEIREERERQEIFRRAQENLELLRDGEAWGVDPNIARQQVDNVREAFRRAQENNGGFDEAAEDAEELDEDGLDEAAEEFDEDDIDDFDGLEADVHADDNELFRILRAISPIAIGPINVLLISFFIICVLVAILFLFYYIPCTVALIILGTQRSIKSFLGTLTDKHIILLSKYFESAIPKEYSQMIADLPSRFPILTTLNLQLLIPYKQMVIRASTFSPKFSFGELLHLTCIGYFFIGYALYGFLQGIESTCSPEKPLKGRYRDIYMILIQGVLTLKVVTIFFIELVAFPIFCGFQLTFVVIPVIIKDESKFFAAENWCYSLSSLLVFEWIYGTLFMYFFASYVSMIRKHILRRGVLFFIRSPDDPNVRLVHDALMKPFGLQLSRILLSGFVYTLYIILEFCIVTWGIRYFSPIKIFPIEVRIRDIFCVFGLYAHKKYTMQTFVPLFRKFWEYVFSVSCSKLRLSSFILDGENLSERGNIVYRSFFKNQFSFLFSNRLDPASLEPLLQSEISEYFEKHPTVDAVFVPNGDFVRAPDNDNVSRLFIKKLFVKVTKDDMLLEKPREITKEEEEAVNPYGDDEPVSITTYKVVYRPPNFVLRIFGLLGCLWFASFLLVLGYVIPTVGLGSLISYFDIIGKTLNLNDEQHADSGSVSNLIQFNLCTLSIGTLLLNWIIALYTWYSSNRENINKIEDGHVNRNEANNRVAGAGDEFDQRANDEGNDIGHIIFNGLEEYFHNNEIIKFCFLYVSITVIDFLVCRTIANHIRAQDLRNASMTSPEYIKYFVAAQFAFAPLVAFFYRPLFMIETFVRYNDQKKAQVILTNARYLLRLKVYILLYSLTYISFKILGLYISTENPLYPHITNISYPVGLLSGALLLPLIIVNGVINCINIVKKLIVFVKYYNYKLKTRYYIRSKVLVNVEEDDQKRTLH